MNDEQKQLMEQIETHEERLKNLVDAYSRLRHYAQTDTPSTTFLKLVAAMRDVVNKHLRQDMLLLDVIAKIRADHEQVTR